MQAICHLSNSTETFSTAKGYTNLSKASAMDCQACRVVRSQHDTTKGEIMLNHTRCKMSCWHRLSPPFFMYALLCCNLLQIGNTFHNLIFVELAKHKTKDVCLFVGLTFS